MHRQNGVLHHENGRYDKNQMRSFFETAHSLWEYHIIGIPDTFLLYWPTMSESDPGFQAALSEAKKGSAEGGVPIGSCLVDKDGKILGQGHNMRVQKSSATLHVCMAPACVSFFCLGSCSGSSPFVKYAVCFVSPLSSIAYTRPFEFGNRR